MLHVLLLILKIIGIVLLVILGLVLALVLLILFVPVKYKLHIRYEEDGADVTGKAGWLFDLLKVDIALVGKRVRAVICVLGRALKTIWLPPDKEPEQGDAEAESGSLAKAEAKAESGPPAIEGSAKDPQESSEGQPPQAGTEAEGQTAQAETRADGQALQAETKAEKNSSQPGDNAGKKKKGPKKSSRAKAFLEVLPQKLLNYIEKLLDLLLKLCDIPYEAFDRIDGIVDRILVKYRAVRKKIDPFLSIEADHLIRKLIGYLKYLLDGYAPRRVEGYLNFGAGEPDLTGLLTGLVYVILPSSGSDYQVEPDFYAPKLRTDTYISGHIRISRLAYVGIRVLTDKEFWRLIGRIRGKKPGKRSRKKSGA